MEVYGVIRELGITPENSLIRFLWIFRIYTKKAEIYNLSCLGYLLIKEIKMNIRKVVTVFVLVLMVNTSAQAMVIPGRWEKVAAEKVGSKIIVTLMTGDRIECAFTGLSTDSLIVSTSNGVEREYSKANVARITTADKRQDSLANGAAIGAAAAGIPVLILIAAFEGANQSDVSVKEAAPGIAVCFGIGAGIGLLVDVVKKDYVTLYEAPQSFIRIP